MTASESDASAVPAPVSDDTLLMIARENEAIHRISTVLAAELDLERLIQTITDEATQAIRAGFGSFFYNAIDEHGESYVLYTLSGVPREAFAKFPMPRNTKIFDPTFRNLGTVRSDDILKDPRYGQNQPYKGMPEGHLPVRSYLAVSVVSRTGDVLGGLFFGHPEPGRFTADHQRILEGIAPQAAIAIENARLYQQARQQQIEAQEGSRLALLSADIGQALTLNNDSRKALQACTDALLRHLSLSWAGIWLSESDGPPVSAGQQPGLPQQLSRWDFLLPGERFVWPDQRESLPNWLKAVDFLVALPLRAESGTVGWLMLTADSALSERVLQALESEARLLALGLEKWQALEQLTYQHQLLRTITDNTAACLLMMDAEGRCTFANSTVASVTGYTPEELLGKTLHAVLHHSRPDGRPYPIEDCPLDRALPRQQAIRNHEDQFIRKDGSFFPVRCSGQPIVRDGQPVGTVIEVLDITEERQANATLLQANQQLAQEKLRQDQLMRAMQAAQRTAARLTAETSRAAACQVVLDLLRQDLDVRIAGIWLFDTSRRQLLLESAYGFDQPCAGLEPVIDVHLNAYKIGWVARYQLPFVAAIEPDDIQFDQSWLRREQMTAALFYPLAGRQAFHGVLAAFLDKPLLPGLSEVVATVTSIFASSLDAL